jgi:hypothetical protein
LSELVIEYEKIKDVWQDLERLAALEQIEIEEERPFQPDWNSMRILNEQGIFQVLTARVDAKIVGYFSWIMDFDLESKGTLIVNQSAWFVEKGYPIVAVKMLDRAIAEFKKIGVEFAYFHHTCKGRGAGLGKLFERKGAKFLGYNYVMKMKPEGWRA